MAQILNNGKEILNGDETSIKMVYNNIINKEKKSKSEYNNYLRFLKSQGFESGTVEIKSLEINEVSKIHL